MSPLTIDRIWQGLLDTLTMVSASALIAALAGIPLALILVLTAPGSTLESPRVHRVLGALINGFRATPFIILLVALLPFTRLVVGATIGVWAAVVPLSISATPFFARMGCERRHIVWHVLLPEALPGIIGGFTLTIVSLIGASAMAGAVGAGGLGDIAIRYGYQRFDTTVMAVVIVLLIALVSLVQWVGDRSVRRLKAR